MELSNLQISIIDTYDNNRVLIEEQTEKAAPRLVYNGEDDKFGHLFTSELTFNMLVKTNNVATFYHLCTGSETRYKLLLEETTDALNPELLWQGFLLPEQFEEPYTHSNFFVNLVATDGIARLKSATLSTSYYKDMHSVIDIIHQCLMYTGLRQSFFFAPAIDNAAFSLAYTDLNVDTSTYIKGSDKLSIYQILEKILTDNALRLFSFKGNWYVLGFNRLKDNEIVCKEYGFDSLLKLEYKGEVTVVRELLQKRFYEAPLVTDLPPLQRVTSIWNKDVVESLIPEDVVSHYPVNFNNDADDRTPKYWSLVTDVSLLLYVWLIELDENFDYNQLNILNHYNGLKAINKTITKVYGPSVFFNGAQVADIAALDNNYATLAEPFFVYGSEDLERYAELKIEWYAQRNFSSYTEAQLQQAIEDGDFDDQFFFAITRKDYKRQSADREEVYLSNFDTAGVPKGSFDFELSLDNGYLRGKLSLEKVLLTEDGWYNIRLYPIIQNDKLTNIKVYDVVNFKLNQEDERIVEQAKSIDYTTSAEITLHHSDSQMSLSKKRYTFSDTLNDQILNGTLFPSEIEITALSYSKVASYNGPNLWYYTIEVHIDLDSYNKLKNGYKLYVLKSGQVDQELVSPNNYILSEKGETRLITQIDFVAVTGEGVFIDETDQVFIKLNEGDDVSLNYPEHWLDKWKRYGVDESLRWQEVLNRIYFDVRQAHSFVLNGTAAALIGPLDVLLFKYIEEKEYYPVRIELNLTQNETDVTLVEQNGAAILYTEETAEEIVVEEVEPSIVIQSSVVEPGMFTWLWAIATSYSIVGVDTINATITASQLTGENGTPTGFVKTGTIATETGTATLSLTLEEAPVYFGWYEVVVEQGGLQSNKEKVFIDSEVVVPTEYITLTKVETGDILSNTGKYTIAFTGFIPTTVTQRLQKIDQITQSPIGGSIDTVVADHTVEQTIDFENKPGLGGGTWKLTVLAGGKESNELGWFSIII